jgi:hypothetical protein
VSLITHIVSFIVLLRAVILNVVEQIVVTVNVVAQFVSVLLKVCMCRRFTSQRLGRFFRRCDSQHTDIRLNDTQHDELICGT